MSSSSHYYFFSLSIETNHDAVIASGAIILWLHHNYSSKDPQRKHIIVSLVSFGFSWFIQWSRSSLRGSFRSFSPFNWWAVKPSWRSLSSNRDLRVFPTHNCTSLGGQKMTAARVTMFARWEEEQHDMWWRLRVSVEIWSARLTTIILLFLAFSYQDCGYVFTKGPKAWADLPDNYSCPPCGAPKRRFKKVPKGSASGKVEVKKSWF